MISTTKFIFTASFLATLANAADWGSCKEPTITFKENAFSPTNKESFSHGGTTDLTPITDYLCSTVQNQCKAPGAAYDLCKKATTAAAKKMGADAATAFNDVIKGTATATTSSAAAQKTTDRQIYMSLTKDYVEFDGDIDPKWWFDNKIQVTDNACDESSVKMPDGNSIIFKCHGNVEGKTVPAMLGALKELTKNGDWFKHYTKKDTYCGSFNTQGGCQAYKSKDKPVTGFPKTFHIYVKQGDFDEGEFSYEISPSAKGIFDCLACKLASSVLGLTGLIAPVLAPIYGAAVIPVTISCATGGC